MSFGVTDSWTLAVILGLAAVTVLTRCFFFISSRPWPMPAWAERGLQYAPIAALAGVVAPEVFMAQDHFITTWQDARVFGAVAGALAFYWRRDVLATIVVGMAVYVPLLLVAGW